MIPPFGSLQPSFDAAWTAKSASRYAATFSEDADWEMLLAAISRAARRLKRPPPTCFGIISAPVHETMTSTRIFMHKHPMSRWLISIRRITGQTGGAGNVLADRHIRMSQVYVKRHGHWQIRVHRVADLRGISKPVSTFSRHSQIELCYRLLVPGVTLSEPIVGREPRERVSQEAFVNQKPFGAI